MNNVCSTLLQAISALQDAHAYLEHAEQMSGKKEYKPVRMKTLGVIDDVVKLYTEERHDKS